MKIHNRYRLSGVMIIAMWLAGCGRAALVPAIQFDRASVLPSPIATARRTATTQATLKPTSTPTRTPPSAPAVTGTSTATPGSTYQTDSQVGQHAYTATVQLTDQDGSIRQVQLGYLLYVPQSYDLSTGQLWPLLLFLHGAGERGDDPAQLAETGLPQILASQPKFPFIVLSPQVPAGQWWEDQLSVLAPLLDLIETQYAVDPKREYLTGLSMGGFGAWAVALRYPQRFAAVVPIAGGWNGSALPPDLCALKNVPIWVFHGEQDVNVPPQQTENMVAALQQCGGQVRFTLYPDADHDGAWQRAYTDPDFYRWLLSQHLP